MLPPGTPQSSPAVAQLVKNAGLNTIFLVVFYQGQAIYPSQVVPQFPGYQGTDPAADMLAAAHDAGLQVYAVVNVLYWKEPGAASPLVDQHPDWRELNAAGRPVGDAGQAGGAFVSPVMPQVTGMLQQLVAEIGGRYRFDGIVFDYLRFSLGDFLGFAPADRKAFLREQRMDPIDIDPLGFATGQTEQELLARWQEQQINELLRSLAGAFRRVAPQGKVGAAIVPEYYRARLRNPARQDWQTWGNQGWIDLAIPRGIAFSTQLQENPLGELALPKTVAVAPMVVPDRANPDLTAASQLAILARFQINSFAIWAAGEYWVRDQVLRDLAAAR